MIKANIKNEKVKRQFLEWLKETQGHCDSTVNSVERAILIYENFTKMADFATFNSDKAKVF